MQSRKHLGSSHHGSVVTNHTSIHKGMGLFPGLTQWVQDLAFPRAVIYVADAARILRCCGYGYGCRLAAGALIRPLAWELPYAPGEDIKSKKKKKDRSSRRGAVVNESD